MMRFKLAAFFILIFGADYAAAQDYSCEIESDGRITLSGDTSHINASLMRTCTNIPVQGARYTMKAFGYCNGEPDEGRGFSNCYTLIDDPITVEFGENSSQSFNAKLPAKGSYSHYFSMIEPVYELAAVVELANDVSTVLGNGFFSTHIAPGALDECPTDPCSAPFTSALPSQNEAKLNNDGAGATHRPTTDPGYVPYAKIRTVTLNPFGFPDIRPFNRTIGHVRARLLNGQLKTTNESRNVNYIMTSFELDEPFVVTGDETSVNVDFDLSTGANFSYFFNDPTNLGDGFNRHWNVPLIWLSQRALTPTIQTSTD